MTLADIPRKTRSATDRLSAISHIYGGGQLDRAHKVRTDAATLETWFSAPDSRVLTLWRGQALVRDAADQTQLAYVPGPVVKASLGKRFEPPIFLGLDGSGPVFAVGMTDPGDPADEEAGPLAGHGHYVDLRSAAGLLDPVSVSYAATAQALLEWHRHNSFCSRCSIPTRRADGGWKRVCVKCGAENFPRLDPVVIMLPIRDGQALLGRQASWPEGRFSALAGFMEPGESLEEACAREIYEESGLLVQRARYHSSQPWPFPHTLMVGMLAEVAEGDLLVDHTEIEEVCWVSREEMGQIMAGLHARIKAPPSLAIAHHLMMAFAEGEGA